MPGTGESTSAADHALIRAARAWGLPDGPESWRRFAPAWRDRLGSPPAVPPRASTGSDLEGLRRDHAASARPDFARIHPSWYVRALRAESPAVRAVIAEHAPSPIRELIAADPGLRGKAPRSARPADPEAIRWALALWTERLLGDVASRPDDPPVVVALTRMAPRDLVRLTRACGQAKHAFAIEGARPSEADEALVRMSALGLVRLAFFRRLIGHADPRLIPAARSDLAAIDGDRHRGHARLGLLTLGRLLGAVEPHRARWALQHLPYPIVREIRERTTPPLPARALAAWESWVLEAAWARLLAEGRLVARPGGPP